LSFVIIDEAFMDTVKVFINKLNNLLEVALLTRCLADFNDDGCFVGLIVPKEYIGNGANLTLIEHCFGQGFQRDYFSVVIQDT